MKYTSIIFPPSESLSIKKQTNTHLVFGERKHVTYIWLRRFYFVRNLVAFPVIFVSFIAPSPHRAERGESDVQVAPSEDDFHPHTVAPSWTLRINKRTHSKNVNNSVRSLLETTKPFFGVCARSFPLAQNSRNCQVKRREVGRPLLGWVIYHRLSLLELVNGWLGACGRYMWSMRSSVRGYTRRDEGEGARGSHLVNRKCAHAQSDWTTNVKACCAGHPWPWTQLFK